MATSLREQIRIAWEKLRGRAPDYSGASVPWEERRPPRGPEGPPGEDSLVPSGPPKRLPRTGAAALPLPEPEDWDVDALGKPVGDD